MKMGFSYADLYPTYSGVDTSNLATPGVDDQDALNENVEAAENASVKEANKKSVFLTIGVMILLVIFFGGGK